VVVGATDVVVGASLVVVGASLVVVGTSLVVVGTSLVVVGATLVVVGALVVLVVVSHVNDPSGDPAPQESQQLVAPPGHACPPRGALHFSALDLMEHFTLPRRSIRQHVTKPGFPHVDFAAHLTASPLHSFGRSPESASSSATPLTQLTYCPWLLAPAQSHSVAASARADATAASSVHCFATAALPVASTSPRLNRP
jgi:hypothetical protein